MVEEGVGRFCMPKLESKESLLWEEVAEGRFVEGLEPWRDCDVRILRRYADSMLDGCGESVLSKLREIRF